MTLIGGTFEISTGRTVTPSGLHARTPDSPGEAAVRPQGVTGRLDVVEQLTAHDRDTLDGVDFRHLPHPPASFDTVCFDPHHSPETSTATDFPGPWTGGGCLLVKCNDFVSGRRLHLGHVHMLTEGLRLGLKVQDLIVHATGTGPGVGAIHTQERAARAHSYLIVFRRPLRAGGR